MDLTLWQPSFMRVILAFSDFIEDLGLLAGPREHYVQGKLFEQNELPRHPNLELQARL